MKILVTGSKGYVGSRLQSTEDVEIIGFDARDGRDIFNAAELKEAMKDVDVVVHLVAYPHRESAPDWPAFKKLNVDGTKAVFNAAVKAKIKRFVYMSTGNVYCFGDGIGDQDDRELPINVDDHPRPEEMHPYPRSKLVAETFLKKNADKMDNVIVLRPNHFAPTPRGIMKLWRGATITMDRLLRYTMNACTREIPESFVILDVIEPTKNYPASRRAEILLS